MCYFHFILLTFVCKFLFSEYIKKKEKKKLLRVVKFSVLGIFELLNFWQNLSTVAYKPVAYKKNRVYENVRSCYKDVRRLLEAKYLAIILIISGILFETEYITLYNILSSIYYIFSSMFTWYI